MERVRHSVEKAFAVAVSTCHSGVLSEQNITFQTGAVRRVARSGSEKWVNSSATDPLFSPGPCRAWAVNVFCGQRAAPGERVGFGKLVARIGEVFGVHTTSRCEKRRLTKIIAEKDKEWERIVEDRLKDNQAPAQSMVSMKDALFDLKLEMNGDEGSGQHRRRP